MKFSRACYFRVIRELVKNRENNVRENKIHKTKINGLFLVTIGFVNMGGMFMFCLDLSLKQE